MAKAKKTKPKASSIVTFLLDRSSSMQSCKGSTIAAFNTYIETLQKSGTPINFNFIQFDSISIDKPYVNIPVKDVPALTDMTYLPRGSTPLIDAAYKTIKAVEALATDKNKVVICIQTDGEENCSTEHTWEELNALIKEKSKLGWEFNFMGAGIDAYQQGVKMGISTQNTVSYDSTDHVSTMASFAATASNTAGFSAGVLRSTAYSGAQKLASGDKFDPGTGSGGGVKPVLKPKTKSKIVDDITL